LAQVFAVAIQVEKYGPQQVLAQVSECLGLLFPGAQIG
jgi:hypothetical protein